MDVRQVVDVILGEARAGDYEDMRAIASVVVNRALATGASLDEVISAPGQFDAYGRSLPKGVDAHRAAAEQALADVLDNGPVHAATFYATPAAVQNLPEGLQPVTETAGHVYFEDPEARPIAVGGGYVAPNLAQVAEVVRPDAYAPATEMQAANDEAFAGLLGTPGPAAPAATPTPSLQSYAMDKPVAPDIPGLSQPAQDMVGQLVSSGLLDPGQITSAFRDATKNAAVRGAKGSQHIQGNAIDISTRGMDPLARDALLGAGIDAGARGIGVYPGGSLHLDVRENPAAWGPGGSYSGQPASAFPDWAQDDIQALQQAPETPPEPASFMAYAGMEAPRVPEAALAAVADPAQRVGDAWGVFDQPQAPPVDPAQRVSEAWGVFDQPQAPPSPDFSSVDSLIGSAPPAGGQQAPPGGSEPDQMASAMDVFAGKANIGRATNGDIIQRDPATGQMTRQSQKYGYTEVIDSSGNFHGFANAPEGSPAASFQNAVHGMMPSGGTMAKIGGAGVGGLLGGPVGALAGGALGSAFAGAQDKAAANQPNQGGGFRSVIGTVAGGALGGLVLGPAGAAIGATISNRLTGGQGLLGGQQGGGLLGSLFSAMTGGTGLGAENTGNGPGTYWNQAGYGNEGSGYTSRLGYSDTGAPLPPSKPGGWSWGGGGGGGVVRDGSDR